MVVDVYNLRKAVLRDFRRALGAPLKPDELPGLSTEPAVKHAPDGAVAAECVNLKLHGYLEAIPGFGGVYLRITPAGAAQLEIETPQDPYIHGPGAV